MGTRLEELIRTSGIVLFLRVSAAALAYVVVVALAKVLPPADYGHYGSIISLTTLLSVFFLFGGNTVVIPFAAEYRHRKASNLSRGLVSFFASMTFKLAGAMTVVAFVAAALVSIAVEAVDLRLVVTYVIAVAVLAPALAIIGTQGAYIRTCGGVWMALLPKDIFWRGLQIMAIIAISVLAVDVEYRLLLFVLVSGASLIALFLWQRRWLFRSYFDLHEQSKSFAEKERWRNSAVVVWGVAIVKASYRSVDVLIIAALLQVEVAGAYFLVRRTVDLMDFVQASVNLIVGPLVARAESGDNSLIQRQLSWIALAISAVNLVAFTLLFSLGQVFLQSLGYLSESAYLALLILGGAQMINGFAGSVGLVLNMTGHERVVAKILVPTIVLTLVGVAALVPVLGIVGAAIASAVGMVAWNLLMWVNVRKLTRLDPSLAGAFHYFRRRI